MAPFRLDGFWPLIKFGGFDLQTYYVIISLAFCAAVFFLVRRARDHQLSVIVALDAMLFEMIFGLIGARLTHVIFEDRAFYAQHPLEVFYVWKGGFVFMGGAITGTLAMIGYLVWKRQPVLEWLDAMAPVGSFGYAFGRLACLVTGCCYGAVCYLANGFSFRHPTQLYAIAWESLVLALLLRVDALTRAKPQRPARVKPGGIFALWVILHACGRILMEIYRADDRGPLIAGLSLSTLVSLLLILGVGTWSVLHKLYKA